MKTKIDKTTGYTQMQAIIGEIMDFQDFPKWDFLNGVLSCEEVLGDFSLWFHWGQLRIIPSDIRYKQVLTARDCDVLEEWNTENDGTITLIPSKEDK